MSAELSTWRRVKGVKKHPKFSFERTPLVVLCGMRPAADLGEPANTATMGGAPVVVLHDGIDPAWILWPQVRLARMVDTGKLTDAEIVEVATAMLDAGISEVHADVDHHFGRPGSTGASPWIFRVDGNK